MPTISRTACLLFLLALLPGSGMPHQQPGRGSNRHTMTRIQPATSAQAETVDPGVMQSIAASEYHIRPQVNSGALQSPNRSQGLRFTYHADGFDATPRRDSLDHWDISLHLLGMGRYATSLLPDCDAANHAGQNHLVYNHPGFEVEYLNTGAGMRQNFILHHSPPGEGPLRVSLAVTSDQLSLACDGSSLKAFRDHQQQFEYSDLKAWDADHRELPSHMELAGDVLSLVVEDAGARYPVTVDPISTTPSALLESTQTGAQMGIEVCTAGDVNGDGYSDVIVGANLYDNGNADEGVAFLFMGGPNGVNTVPALMLERNVTNMQFGSRVSNAGDVNGDGFSDVLIGALYYTNPEVWEGAVFVYHGSASGLSSTPAVVLEGNQMVAFFSFSVATAGDVNRDGYSDILVGAPNYDNGNTDEGRTYVYHGSAAGIIPAPASLLEVNLDNANLGFDAASAGDVNGDGYSDVVAGAYGFTSGQTNEGAMYVFHGSASGVSLVPAGYAESNQVSANLGVSVATAGDVNGDGYSDVIAGAWAYDNGQADEGVAYIYHGSAAGISFTPALMLESNQASANFGCAVACAGDLNADGYADVVVGARAYDNGEADEGGAYIFNGSSTGIISTPLVILERNQSGSMYGASVNPAGDVNGDGFSDIVVGAFFYTNDQPNEGAAFVYHGASNGVSTVPSLILQENQVVANFGWSMSQAGDINADGYDDIVVGAMFYDNGQSNEGAAFIYMGGPAGLSPVYALMVESNQADAWMGNAVGAAGDVNGDGYDDVLVACYIYDNPDPQEGRVYVYHGSAAGLVTPAAVILECNQSVANFGVDVTGAGDINADGYSDIAVSAWLYDNGQTDEGVVFVYYGSATGIPAAPSLLLENNLAFFRFGSGLGTAGDVNGDGFCDLIVGCYRWSSPESQEGAAFIYHGGAGGLNPVAATVIESNQANANMGQGVGTAGDVNGDGFWDVFVGAINYDNGQTDEGAIFIYHGSAAGVVTTPVTMIQSNLASAHMGYYSSEAGDVNGDGYADFIAGAENYTNTLSNEGASWLHLGGPAGLSATPAVAFYGGQTTTQMGRAMSAAGDVNADGFCDMLLGAPSYDLPEVAEGVVFVHYGNAATGMPARMGLYNTSLIPLIDVTNISSTQFGAGIMTKPYPGRMNVKAVWETRPQESGFSVAGTLTSSTAFTAQDAAWTDTGLSSFELTAIVSKEISVPYDPDVTKIRMRLRYDPVTMVTGQVFGPWRYMPGYFGGENIHNNHPIYTTGVLPVNIYNWSGTRVPEGVELRWTVSPDPAVQQFVVERSTDGLQFESLTTVPSALTSDYKAMDLHPAPVNHYRLRTILSDGTTSLSGVITIFSAVSGGVAVWPQPASDLLHIAASSPITRLTLTDAAGRQLLSQACTRSEETLSLIGLQSGAYFLHITTTESEQVKKVWVK